MKKKPKIIPLSACLLLLLLVVAANVWRSRSLVRGVRADIDYQGGDTLITPQQVSQLILDANPRLTSTMLRHVDLEAVERTAALSPYLAHCKAGTTIGAGVVLFATQRRPIVRICTHEEYYLDAACHRIPTSATGSCDVIVASGNIPVSGAGLRQVWTLASYLHQHPTLSPLFDQIYRDARGDLYLTPKLGNHVVQVGSVDDLDHKFHNLMAFYTRGMPRVGWEKYSQVSVKYRGQVVCTRR